jgi:hypothetical protein
MDGCMDGRTRLDGSGNAVTGARQALAGLLGGRLLGVGGDWRCVNGGDGRGRQGKGVLFSEACSPSPLRRASDMMIVGWWLVVGWVLEVECR